MATADDIDLIPHFIEHLKTRKVTIVATVVVGALMAYPTVGFVMLTMDWGPIIFPLAFGMYFLAVVVCWHTVKDYAAYYWKRRQRNGDRTDQ